MPLNPKGEGVENVVFNAFSIGTNANELQQVNNTYQVLDNFSRIVHNHTLRFGGEFHIDQIDTNPIAQFNGNFLFTGSETGSDFADFLLGIPSQYNQSQLNTFYGRNKYAGLFAQDSWRIRPNLTLNYGLRWDRIEPWYEKYNGISAFAPGRQSVVFRARRKASCSPLTPAFHGRSRRPATAIFRRASDSPGHPVQARMQFSAMFSAALEKPAFAPASERTIRRSKR